MHDMTRTTRLVTKLEVREIHGPEPRGEIPGELGGAWSPQIQIKRPMLWSELGQSEKVSALSGIT
jgi:hypothetical protein